MAKKEMIFEILKCSKGKVISIKGNNKVFTGKLYNLNDRDANIGYFDASLKTRGKDSKYIIVRTKGNSVIAQGLHIPPVKVESIEVFL